VDALEKQKRTLPPNWSSFLYEKAESGMGYQVVDIILNDETVVKDVAIIESHLVGQIRGYKGSMPPFDMANIKEIRLTHRRWDFSKE